MREILEGVWISCAPSPQAAGAYALAPGRRLPPEYADAPGSSNSSTRRVDFRPSNSSRRRGGPGTSEDPSTRPTARPQRWFVSHTHALVVRCLRVDVACNCVLCACPLPANLWVGFERRAIQQLAQAVTLAPLAHRRMIAVRPTYPLSRPPYASDNSDRSIRTTWATVHHASQRGRSGVWPPNAQLYRPTLE